MRKKEVITIVLLLNLLLIANISALYVEEDSKISFGHALRVKNISVDDLSPGEQGFIKINLKNNADYTITDVRARLTLPTQVQLLNDVNEIRIAEIKSMDIKEIEYKIISLPTASEGIYGASILVNYVSHYGVNAVNFGDENQDNYSFGIMIKSDPSIFMQLESSEIYRGNIIGDISLKFVNNGTSDIKFLTVTLAESPDYEIISDNKNYIGDLDSDDFQSAKFNIKLNTKKSSIDLPVTISFRDSMNNPYTKQMHALLRIRTASELGKSNGNYAWLILILIIISAAAGYYLYKRGKRKKNKFKI